MSETDEITLLKEENEMLSEKIKMVIEEYEEEYQTILEELANYKEENIGLKELLANVNKDIEDSIKNSVVHSPLKPIPVFLDEPEEESKPNAKDDVEWELELTKKRTVELEKELENLSIAGNIDTNENVKN